MSAPANGASGLASLSHPLETSALWQVIQWLQEDWPGLELRPNTGETKVLRDENGIAVLSAISTSGGIWSVQVDQAWARGFGLRLWKDERS